MARPLGVPRRLGAALLAACLAGSACGEGSDPTPSPPRPEASPTEFAATLDPVLHALGDVDPGVRLAAARTLAEGKVTSVAALTRLSEAAEDENRWVREWAVRALARLGPDAAPAVGVLTRALHDRDSFVRYRAAMALAAIGPGAAAATKRLEEIVASGQETEIGHHWAEQALLRIRGERGR